MAGNYYGDWNSLAAAFSRATKRILKNNVAPVAEDIMRKHIKSDIYNVYTPKRGAWVNGTTYQRRHILESSVTSNVINQDTLFVTSTATASPAIVSGWSFNNRYDGAFLELLESGHMGIWKSGFPRPAVSNTQREFDTSKEIISAIKRGIKSEIGACIEE